MESLNSSQNNINVEVNSSGNSNGQRLSKAPSTGSIHTEKSVESRDSSASNRSKDSTDAKRVKVSTTQLPTFTNEVVVIRPEIFYENEDCQKDNKFMKNSGLKRQSTNDLVSDVN